MSARWITKVTSTTTVEGGRIERVLWSNGTKGWRAWSSSTGRSYNERTRVEALATLAAVTKYAR